MIILSNHLFGKKLDRFKNANKISYYLAYQHEDSDLFDHYFEEKARHLKINHIIVKRASFLSDIVI